MSESRLLIPPLEFEGTLGDLVEEYIIPNLPSNDALIEWTEMLLNYILQSHDPILIVRGQKKGHLRRAGDARIVDSDNSPGIWCYLRCFENTLAPLQIPEAIARGDIPILMALSANRRPERNYGKEMAFLDKEFWALGLKHCHLLQLGVPGLSPAQQALRNLSPINHFLFPSPKKYRMGRVGWSESNNVTDLGESKTVIGWVQHRMMERIGKRGQAVYARFLAETNGERLPIPSPTVRIMLMRHNDDRKQSHPRMARTHPNIWPLAQEHVFPRNASAANKVWTLNEKHGYYVATRLKDSIIDLNLRFKSLNGETSTVGRFVLDLEILVKSGVVTRRSIGGQCAYCLRILRDPANEYWLTVRSSARIPLQQFAWNNNGA